MFLSRSKVILSTRNDEGKKMDDLEYHLGQLGLCNYEARAMIALLRKNRCTAQAVAESASVPYTKIYATLISLAKRGFILSTNTRPKMYMPVDPDTLFTSALERREREYECLKEDLKKGRMLLRQVFENGNSSD